MGTTSTNANINKHQHQQTQSSVAETRQSPQELSYLFQEVMTMIAIRCFVLAICLLFGADAAKKHQNSRRLAKDFMRLSDSTVIDILDARYASKSELQIVKAAAASHKCQIGRYDCNGCGGSDPDNSIARKYHKKTVTFDVPF